MGLDKSAYLNPLDGISLFEVIQGKTGLRDRPIPFKRMEGGAVIDNDWKIVSPDLVKGKFELYNLASDPLEKTDLFKSEPAQATRMMTLWHAFDASRLSSIAGNDYEERAVWPDPQDRIEGVFWWELPQYAPYLNEWLERPEYETHVKRWLSEGR